MTSTYREHKTVPADLHKPVWEDGRLVNTNALKWANDNPPPPVGTEIVITMWTTPGVGRVKGYFEEGNWLGLLVSLLDRPDWHAKSNPHDNTGYIFGPEFRLVDQTGCPNEMERAALASYAKQWGRTWKEALRNDWFHARTQSNWDWPDRGNILHRLRNTPAFGPTGLDKFRLEQKEKVK